MRTRVLPALAVGVLLLSDAASLDRALGQPVQPQPQPAVAGAFQVVELPATVESVDPQARQVLLRLADDTFVTLRVGPQVRNLAQLKPGDRVSARYTEAVAVRLARPEGSAGTPASQPGDAATGASAARPGPVLAGQIEQRGTVQAIDRASNTISFAGPDNVAHTVAARDPGMVEFVRALSVGDAIEVVYVEGVAIDLAPMQR